MIYLSQALARSSTFAAANKQDKIDPPRQPTRTPAVYREREPLQTLQEQYRGAAEQQRAHRRERPSQTRRGINGGARCEFSARRGSL